MKNFLKRLTTNELTGWDVAILVLITVCIASFLVLKYGHNLK